MKILPSDLGMQHHAALLRLRAMSAGTGTTGNAGASGSFLSMPSKGDRQAKPGLLGRMWVSGLGLDDSAAASVLDGVKPMSYGTIGGFVGGGGMGMLGPIIASLANHNPALAAVFGAVSMGFVGVGFTSPGLMLRHWNRKPLTSGEMDTLIHSIAENPLEKTYLMLVRDLVQQDVPDAAAVEVCQSLNSIGEAIYKLPNVSVYGTQEDDVLLASAEASHQAALQEPDSVIAASLFRRAEAQASAAQAASHSALMIRRAKALRDELMAQMEALRLGIASYQSGETDTTHLTRLAGRVRSVATEATTIAQSKNELEAAVGGLNPTPHRAAESDTPILRGGIR